jgi:hypothetical protein
MGKAKGSPKTGGRLPGSLNRNKEIVYKQLLSDIIGSFKSGSYYVYYHINDKTNEVFYVGKGCNSRAWNKGARNDKWLKYVELIGYGYSVRIVASLLSESEALVIESSLIKLLNPKCNIAQL